MKTIFTFLTVLFTSVALLAQEPQIPIDFELVDSTYQFNDFAGGVASIIANPDASGINTSANVGQMVKFAGEVYGGSTLILGGAIDFAGNNAIGMKVWANKVGASVTFKLEGPSPVEVTATTTVANEWEELRYSFAGLTGLEYTAITIIYELGTVGDGSADFTMYFDDISFAASTAGVSIPVDFESTELTYNFADFAGGAATIIDNPQSGGINTSAKVGQMVKSAGEVFGGSTLSLGEAVNFGENNAISMKVFANRVGANVLFKLEGPTPVEVNATTTVANDWEELTYSFAGLTGGVYTGITIIYELGTIGDGSADFTILFDDINYANLTQGVALPVDFESTELTYTFSDFAGGAATVIDNPQSGGINTSAKVGQMIKSAGEVFGGSTLALGSPVDFGSNNAITMKVFGNRVGADVLFKLEGPTAVEVTATTTVANEWEELTYSFAGLTGGVYTGITIIYELGTVGDGSADFTLLFDDMNYASISIGGVQLPINFESTELTYNFSDFAGGAASVIDNPDATGINTSAKVVQMIKSAGEVFGGSTLALGGPIDFGDNTTIYMKVWANRVGAPVLFKLEGPTPVEVSASTTVANEWETLAYDFSGSTGGVYTGITIIYDLGIVGDGSANFTMFFDDIAFSATSSVVDLEDLQVEIFPNPTTDFIQVKAENNIDQISIFDLSGKLVYSNRPMDTFKNIDLSNQLPGIYVMKIATDGNVGTAKIIRQ